MGYSNFFDYRVKDRSADLGPLCSKALQMTEKNFKGRLMKFPNGVLNAWRLEGSARDLRGFDGEVIGVPYGEQDIPAGTVALVLGFRAVETKQERKYAFLILIGEEVYLAPRRDNSFEFEIVEDDAPEEGAPVPDR